MSSAGLMDQHALFADVVAVARTARGATAGWRTICVRAMRSIGRGLIQPLSELDLDAEVTALAARVGAMAGEAPLDIDTLVFSLFEGVGDDGPHTGVHVGGATGLDPDTRWLPRTLPWVPDERFLSSASLDAIASAGARARGEAKVAIAYPLRFGAAALLGRFAADGLPHRVVVAFDDGDCAAIRDGVARSRGRAAPDTTASTP
jgi:hypothetical protein